MKDLITSGGSGLQEVSQLLEVCLVTAGYVYHCFSCVCSVVFAVQLIVRI